MKASLFIPCTVDVAMPDIGEAVVRLLRRLGIDVVYHEKQTCCGQALYNAGHRREAASLAKRFINVFGEDDYIVCPSGSCVYMVKAHYPELLENDPSWRKRADSIAGAVYEFSEFLVDVMKIDDVGAEYHGKVAYHESCHLNRALGISEQPKRLIQTVKGTELVPLNNADKCCGFGGEFSTEFADVSEILVKDKVDNFLSSGAEWLLVSEPGCLMNINGYMSRRHQKKKARHLASFLAGF